MPGPSNGWWFAPTNLGGGGPGGASLQEKLESQSEITFCPHEEDQTMACHVTESNMESS